MSAPSGCIWDCRASFQSFYSADKKLVDKHTLVKLLDKIEMSEVMSRMFVRQMKMNIRGGPSIGEI